MYANFFNSSLLAHNKITARCDSLRRNIHLRARGIIEEFHTPLTISVNLHAWLPVEGATEILHRWHHTVILHHESLWLVESLEMGVTKSFFLVEELRMGINKYGNWMHGI